MFESKNFRITKSFIIKFCTQMTFVIIQISTHQVHKAVYTFNECWAEQKRTCLGECTPPCVCHSWVHSHWRPHVTNVCWWRTFVRHSSGISFDVRSFTTYLASGKQTWPKCLFTFAAKSTLGKCTRLLVFGQTHLLNVYAALCTSNCFFFQHGKSCIHRQTHI